jgi:hypothetical protein
MTVTPVRARTSASASVRPTSEPQSTRTISTCWSKGTTLLRDRGGEHTAGDRRQRQHVVRASLVELPHGLGRVGPRDDLDVGVGLPDDQRGEHRRRVVGDGDDDRRGLVEPRLPERRLVGDVADDVDPGELPAVEDDRLDRAVDPVDDRGPDLVVAGDDHRPAVPATALGEARLLQLP